MAQIEQSDGGKKKKGAQKKMHIHVDFTPMVDMNMLLITFFMLCTTMIKSQTLSIALPAPPDPNQERTQDNSETVAETKAITLIIDSERDKDGNIVTDADGNPNDVVYYYFGFEPTIDENKKRHFRWRRLQSRQYCQSREICRKRRQRHTRHTPRAPRQKRPGARKARKLQGSVASRQDYRGGIPEYRPRSPQRQYVHNPSAGYRKGNTPGLMAECDISPRRNADQPDLSISYRHLHTHRLSVDSRLQTS